MVSTISYQNVSAVISNFPIGKYELSRENLLAHQRVVERVIGEHTTLPVRAFTVASNAEEVRDFLRKRYAELTGLLRDMDNKVELGLAAYWKDMTSIFQEIVDENKAIKQLRERIAVAPERRTLKDKVALGEMVANALKAKREREAEELLRPFKRIAFDLRRNDVRSDDMILNAAFLTDRAWEKEFDRQVGELDRKCAQRIRLKYIGPMPPYNFVNLAM
jgi:hypothetical protein